LSCGFQGSWAINTVRTAARELREWLVREKVKDMTIRAMSLARAGYGAFLLCAPDVAIGLCTARQPSSRARAVARLLGARHLVQAAVTARTPTPAVLAVGAQVDLVHAASMLALGAANRSLRSAPLSDALAAVIFAALGAACAPTPAVARVPGLVRLAGGSGEVLSAPTKGDMPCISASEPS
jgi:hypothetical protein